MKRLLRIHQIIAPNGCLPIGRTKFYEAIANGLIPESTKFGTVSLWDSDAIQAFLKRILAGELGPNFSAAPEREQGRRAPQRVAA